MIPDWVPFAGFAGFWALYGLASIGRRFSKSEGQ